MIRSIRSILKFSPTEFVNRPQVLQGSSRNYRKFVVLAHQRSGSSLIIGSLREHPQVLGFGELFVDGRIGFNIKGYDNHSQALLEARKKFPIEFLERYIFSSYPEEINAVGFKLFPDQIDNKNYRCVWGWLERNRDITVISLTRRNLLATYTSLLIAKKTKTYGITDESQRSSATVTIDVDECLSEFRKRAEYNAISRKLIANLRAMEITYEELAADPRSHILRIQEFIGVSARAPEIGQIKQEVRPLSEAITNYEKLRRDLSRTEWAYCFEEE